MLSLKRLITLSIRPSSLPCILPGCVYLRLSICTMMIFQSFLWRLIRGAREMILKKFLSICTGIQHTVLQRASKLKAHIQRLPGRAFVQPGKIEIDANERAVIKEFKAAFSFVPPSILSLTICKKMS